MSELIRNRKEEETRKIRNNWNPPPLRLNRKKPWKTIILVNCENNQK